MIEACSRVGTPEEKATYLAKVMVVAAKPLVQQGKGNRLKCFNWWKRGHFKAQCCARAMKESKATAISTGSSINCNRCDKFGHREIECKLRCKKDGMLLGNERQGVKVGHTMTKIHLQSQVAAWMTSTQ